MPKVIILDTETSGVCAKSQVIELAYIELTPCLKSILNSLEQRFKPSVEINKHSYAVHGIGIRELLNKPKTSTVDVWEDAYIIGANISFDIRLLTQSNPNLKFTNTRLICVLELAKILNKIKPRFSNFKLATLYEYYYPTCELNTVKYHTAMNDVIKTYRVLTSLLESLPALTSVDEVYDFIQATKKVKNV